MASEQRGPRGLGGPLCQQPHWKGLSSQQPRSVLSRQVEKTLLTPAGRRGLLGLEGAEGAERGSTRLPRGYSAEKKQDGAIIPGHLERSLDSTGT